MGIRPSIVLHEASREYILALDRYKTQEEISSIPMFGRWYWRDTEGQKERTMDTSYMIWPTHWVAKHFV